MILIVSLRVYLEEVKLTYSVDGEDNTTSTFIVPYLGYTALASQLMVWEFTGQAFVGSGANALMGDAIPTML